MKFTSKGFHSMSLSNSVLGVLLCYEGGLVIILVTLVRLRLLELNFQYQNIMPKACNSFTLVLPIPKLLFSTCWSSFF